MDNKNRNTRLYGRYTTETLNGKQTKQLLLDPNAGNENIPIEDLSIECELSVYERSRSFIKVVQGDGEETKKLIGRLLEKEAPFNKGNDSSGSFNLTTDYTRYSDMDYDGLETLGITNVNVDYNASYMPLVTIELTDVKGKMFQMGKNGPYSPFFNFPYPLFELKIKGYFGKPVIYLLHMTNFTSKMDSENGNFQITCTFTGYTHAYLSDMLLGYLKAVPFTTAGKKQLEIKKKEDGSFVSFDLLYEYGKKLNEEMVKLKDTEDVQAIALAHSTIDKLKSIKNDVFRKIKQIDGANYDVTISEPTMLFLPMYKTNDKSYETITDFFEDTIHDEISEYNKMVGGSKHGLSFDLVKIKDGYNVFENLKKEHFLNDDETLLGKNKSKYKKFDETKDSDKGMECFKRVALGVKSILPKMEDGKEFKLIYVYDLISEIDNRINTINEEIKDAQDKTQDNTMDRFSNLTIDGQEGELNSFDFNIRNYTKVLADHVDILMRTIKAVGLEAEDNADRNAALVSGGETYDVNMDKTNNAKKIFAFPDYKEKYTPDNKTNATFADEWIGKKYPTINEVKFIEELYEGILSAQKSEEIFLTEIEDTNIQWYGVNPFDCVLFTEKNNPWESVSNSTGADGEIFRLLTMRAITFLGVTVRNPSDMEAKAMAKLEAENLFRTILNADVKDFLATIGNKDEDIATEIRRYVNQRNDLMANAFSKINDNRIITNLQKWVNGAVNDEGADGSKKFEVYSYIAGHTTSTNISDVEDNVGTIDKDTRYFLPLYFAGNKNNYNGNVFVKGNELITNEERIGLRESGNIFFGDYMGNHVKGNDRIDVGATYIRLIDNSEYDGEDIAPIKYGGNHLEGIKYGFVWEYEDVKSGKVTNTLFNGKFHSNEYMRYKKDGGEYDFYNYFYKDESVANTPPQPTLSQEFPNIFTRKYSLFGSNFYYSQTRAGRAYLFLASIPYKVNTDFVQRPGKVIFHEEILNLFDKKAGMVQMPYSYILYLGALLYRKEVKEILTFEKHGFSTLPSSLAIPPSVDEIPLYTTDRNYKAKFDTVLGKLPDNVKDIFKDEFIAWAKPGGGFDTIRRELELFKNPHSKNAVADYYVSLAENTKKIETKEFINERAINTYSSISVSKWNEWGDPIDGTIWDDDLADLIKENGYTVVNFDLEFNENSEGYQRVYREFLRESKILVNSTWRIWANDLDMWYKDIRVNKVSTFPFTFSTDKFNIYLTSFVREFRDLVKNFHDDELRASQIFGSTNMTNIYLTMYKNIKSINDKWVCGENKQIRESFVNLMDTFKFIDRGYNNIGEAFKLNPLHVTSLLRSNYNTSFYAHIVKILNKNNFDFIPMPNYINMQNKKTIEDMFKTYSYGTTEGTATPSFVCMYIGEQSNRLEDVGDNYPGDGINFGDDEKALPDDFERVPAILVRYGDQNQSIFKSIQLDQSEFSETNESLMTTDQIATSYNSVNSVGQNIFDVYNNRAYNASIELMGNAMIQPFLYFQLDNIPMFRGGYVIKKVSHNLTPHNMTTSIVGNRVKYVKTKLLDKEAIFYSMIGDLSKISTDGVRYGSLSNIKRVGKKKVCSFQHIIDAFTYNEDEDESTIKLSENYVLSDFADDHKTLGGRTPNEIRDNLKQVAKNLEVLMKELGVKKLKLNSAFRTQPHNTATDGAATDSQHLLGKAVDINTEGTGLNAKKLYELIEKLKKEKKMDMGGIGLYNTFVHYDIRGHYASWDFSSTYDI